MWLRMPTAQRPQRARYDGGSHLRQRQIASVRAASKTVQTGKQSNECVMLRCQVTINIGLLEIKSRRTSESGKMAPSVSDHVMTRRLFTETGGNRSAPLNAAFARSAPAIPWVIVSMNRKMLWIMRP